MIMFATMNPHYKDLKPEDCLSLPWDKQGKVVPLKLTEEQLKKQRKVFDKMDAEAKAEHQKTNGKI